MINVNLFKKNVRQIAFALTLVLFMCASCESKKTTSEYTNYESSGYQYVDEESSEMYVWICTGPRSKKYHNNKNCRGLRRCSGERRSVSVQTAESMGRTPCGFCY